jgi:hypothetical protein
MGVCAAQSPTPFKISCFVVALVFLQNHPPPSTTSIIMGRVARYKKIKSFDPYSKQNGGRIADSLETVGIWGLGDNGRRITKKRSRTAEVLFQRKLKRRKANGKDNDDDDVDHRNSRKSDFDMPPGKGDDFDMDDMVGSIKKEALPSLAGDDSSTQRPVGKTVHLSQGLKATIPETEREEKNMVKLLNIKPENFMAENNKKKNAVPPAGRMEGESKRAYHKRAKSETRQIIRRERMESNNPEKRKRKNEFLAEKKQKKSKKGNHTNHNNSRSDDDDGNSRYDHDDLVTGERAAAAAAQDYICFGEQAERPPDFRQLPRGAKKQQPTKSTTATKGVQKKEQQVAAEQAAIMENLRRKVQAQYAVIKMKRKQAGDFHL